MIFMYLTLVAVLGIIDILGLKKTGAFRDILVYCGSMLLVAVMGVIYLSDTFRPSIANYLLRLLDTRE